VARSIREARRDSGLSARQLANAAGVSLHTVQDLEAARRDAGLEVLARVSEALGTPLRVWLEPGTGPAVHDKWQAPMLGALTRDLHRDWRPTMEVGVQEPVKGWIDAVLDRRRTGDCVATECESGLYRIEQQVRWARAKADALALARSAEDRPAAVSQVLLLRSTPTTRSIAAAYSDVLTAAYPAPMVDALAALTGTAAWPGPAVIWCHADRSGARLLDHPPRGIRVGA
jgi:transcriptional regulator with XRE-family HTH domain